jgi:hypothetical protein
LQALLCRSECDVQRAGASNETSCVDHCACLRGVPLGILAPASATVIGFEDLDAGNLFISVPPGYQGLTWSNGGQVGMLGEFAWVISPESSHIFSGTQAHSGTNFAWSNGGSDLSSSGGTFSVDSLWARIGNAFVTTGSATVHGFNGSTEIFAQQLELTDAYQLFVLNFIGITSWTLTNPTSNVLIDDISISNTPIPAALPLFGTGLGLMGLMGWWRKRRAEIVA